jgi:hypothetical protein
MDGQMEDVLFSNIFIFSVFIDKYLKISGVYIVAYSPPPPLSRPNRGGEGNQEEGEGKEGKKKKGRKKRERKKRKKKEQKICPDCR